jgi:hypothetical protein
MEEFGEKGLGKARGLKAAVKGLRGVFRTLAEEHGEVSAILNRAKAAKEPEKRLDLWSKVRMELLSHERGETNVVYPEFKKNAQLAHIADEHEKEASDIEARIKELDGIDTASEIWDAKLDDLIKLVKQHVDEEENGYFPEAMNVLGKDEAEELNGRFIAAKEAAQEQLH